MNQRMNQSSTSAINNSADDFWTKSPAAGQTVVKLRGGSGSPLIILHGGGGSIHAFSPLKNNFSTALWAIQYTPDTPMHTLQAQSQFYFEKIKKEQMNGPYRICAFSASSMLAIAIVQLLEKNGDTVAQLSFIDHFPTTFLAPLLGVDISIIPLDHPCARREFVAASVENLTAMTQRDGRGKLLKRHKMANELCDAFQGLPVSPTMENFKNFLDRFLNQTFDFLVSLRIDARAKGDTQPGMGFLENWLKSVKAPVTAYLSTYGMLGSLTLENHPPEAWFDLGIRRCFPNAKVTVLDAGHYDILGNAGLLRGLQEDYITNRARL